MNIHTSTVSIAIALALCADNWIHAETPIVVGTSKQLFVDDLFFATADGIALKVQPPRKTGEVVLKSEHPWESATINWFNVLEDQGRVDSQAKYRMWYEVYDIAGWPTGDDTAFCYAESRDGVTWTKPELNLFSYQGSTRNNILFRQIGTAAGGNRSRVHGVGVFIDPNAPAAARFKAVSQGLFSKLNQPPHRVTGMHSPDGLKWTRYSDPICDLFADSQYSGFWDKTLEKYVIYGRVGGQVGRSESDDFAHFKTLTSVVRSNDKDPRNSRLYNPAVRQYPFAENIYFAFPSLYQETPDTVDIRLAVSRDGLHWSRPDQETPWIALGEQGCFDSGTLYMGQGMIRKGDEVWMYYSGSPLLHGETNLENLADRRNARVYSRVVMPLDRFIAAVADSNGGTFTTPPLLFSGSRLKLNLAVAPAGSVRIGLLDDAGDPIPGRSLNECILMVGDSLDEQVRWRDGSDVGARDNQQIRLQVEMNDASLFGFQFVP